MISSFLQQITGYFLIWIKRIREYPVFLPVQAEKDKKIRGKDIILSFSGLQMVRIEGSMGIKWG